MTPIARRSVDERRSRTSSARHSRSEPSRISYSPKRGEKTIGGAPVPA